MNFKRYHVSKNLFDATAVSKGRINTSTGAIEYAEDTSTLTYSDTNNEFTITTRYAWRGFVTEYIDLQEKPVFSYISDDGTFYAFFYAYDANKNFLGVVSSSVPTGTKYIRGSIQCGTAATNAKIKNIMLNTGSQPLPYEPYSSEVWHNIPHYIMGTDTDTITTLPADIYANDTTATVGLKGNMEQSGTPTPTTPIQPQETGERTGNLVDYNFLFSNDYDRQSDYFNYYKIVATPNTTYTISSNAPYSELGNQTTFMIGLTNIQTTVDNGVFGAKTITTDASGELYVAIRIKNGSQIAKAVIDDYISGAYYVMLNSGSTALPYEPYGYKIPISSANTTTPVYLGEVQSTRRIYKFILDGTEDWKVLSSDNSKYYLDYLANDYLRASSQVTYMCTHYIPYEQTVSATLVPNLKMSMSSGNAQRLYIADTNFTTTDQFKTYLQQQYANGTPVTVWYILATPTTGIVNEPIRKIGDYADEVSGITIPTIAGANSFDVLTTLKPSEVTVNYHGWHPVADVHERESGAWD